MSKPWIHAVSSAKKFGGKPEDYLPIHNLFDLSKGAIADHRHRVLTHNSFFIGVMLERIPFPNSAPPAGGLYTTIINSEGKHVSVRDIGEQHCLEDFRGFIPTLQDYADHMEMAPWMNNGNGEPNSTARIKRAESQDKKTGTKFIPFDNKEEEELNKIKEDLNTPTGIKPPELDELLAESLKRFKKDAKKTHTPVINPPLEEKSDPMYYDDVLGPIDNSWSRNLRRGDMVLDGAHNPNFNGLDDLVADGVNHPETRSGLDYTVLDGDLPDSQLSSPLQPRNSMRSDFLID